MYLQFPQSTTPAPVIGFSEKLWALYAQQQQVVDDLRGHVALLELLGPGDELSAACVTLDAAGVVLAQFEIALGKTR